MAVFNSEYEVVLSANMPEHWMYEASALEGPCAVSASKLIEPCVRNTFVVTRWVTTRPEK